MGHASAKLSSPAAIGLTDRRILLVLTWMRIRTETVKTDRDRLLAFTDEHQAAAVAKFIATYSLVTGLSLPGATILTITEDFCQFQSLLGTVFTSISGQPAILLAFLTAAISLTQIGRAEVRPEAGSDSRGFCKKCSANS